MKTSGMLLVSQRKNWQTMWIAGGLTVGISVASALAFEPHVHGQGQILLAQDKAQLAAEIRLPGMNVLGFEHEAQSDADKARLQSVLARLKTDDGLLKPSPEARCQRAHFEAEYSNEVYLGAPGQDMDMRPAEDEGEHEKSVVAEPPKEGRAEPVAPEAPKVHEHHEHEEDEHRSLIIAIGYQCQTPSAVSQITTSIFKLFPGIQKLNVQIASDGGQKQQIITGADPVIRLK